KLWVKVSDGVGVTPFRSVVWKIRRLVQIQSPQFSSITVRLVSLLEWSQSDGEPRDSVNISSSLRLRDRLHPNSQVPSGKALTWRTLPVKSPESPTCLFCNWIASRVPTRNGCSQIRPKPRVDKSRT